MEKKHAIWPETGNCSIWTFCPSTLMRRFTFPLNIKPAMTFKQVSKYSKIYPDTSISYMVRIPFTYQKEKLPHYYSWICWDSFIRGRKEIHIFMSMGKMSYIAGRKNLLWIIVWLSSIVMDILSLMISLIFGSEHHSRYDIAHFDCDTINLKDVRFQKISGIYIQDGKFM